MLPPRTASLGSVRTMAVHPASTTHRQLDAAALAAAGIPQGLIRVSVGLEDADLAGLAAAVGDPGHPIARTVATPVSSFDVSPTRPGGPALRSHLPLIVRRGGSDVVLGVLALAHDRAIDPAMRPLVQAGPDLAAVAIEGRRAG